MQPGIGIGYSPKGRIPKGIHSYVCLSASVLKTNLPKMFFPEIIITPDYKLSKAKAKVSP